MIFKNEYSIEEISQCVNDFIQRSLLTLPNQIKLGNLFDFLTELSLSEDIKLNLSKLEEILMNQSSYNTFGRQEFINIYVHSTTDIKEIDKRATFARLVLVHLARNKMCTLSPIFKLSINDQTSWKTVTSYKEFYPNSVVSLLSMSTEKRALDNRDLIDPKILDAALSNSTKSGDLYKSINSNCNTLARCCLVEGVESIEDITIDDFIKYRNGLADAGDTNGISCNYLFELIDIAYNKNLLNEYKKSDDIKSMPRKDVESGSERNVLFGKNVQVKKIIGELFNSRNNKKIIVHPEFIRLPYKREAKIVDYGYWSSQGGSNSDYTPSSCDQDNPWIIAQNQYIRSIAGELSTEISISRRLSFLNLYLFSYLPEYYSNNKNDIFPYPDVPYKFIGNVFVTRNLIFESEACIPKDFKYPVSLEKFVIDLTLAGQKENTFANNVGRDTIAELRRFFSYLGTMSSFEKYYVKSNPFDTVSNGSKIGFKPIKSSKNLFNIRYWCLLRLFLKKVTESILRENKTALKNGESISTNSVKVDKTITFEDDIVYIGDVDLSSFPKCNFKRNGKSLKLFRYQPWSHSVFMSYSGQRNSNASWVDADNVFSGVSDKALEQCEKYINGEDVGEEKIIDSLHPIAINTDKAKNHHFATHVPTEVLCILYLTKHIRSFNESASFNEAQFYQGNENSKWGKIKPLFQFANVHLRDFETYFDEIIVEFEKTLVRNNIRFESVLSYVPLYAYSKDEFFYLISNNAFDEKFCTVDIQYENGCVPFIPLKAKARQSPHSLRVEVDSVFVPIVGEKVVSELLTGQTEGTVSFYTKPFTDDASADLLNNVISLLLHSKVVSANEFQLDPSKFREDVRNGTAIEKYGCKAFNFGSVSDESFGLGQLQLGVLSEFAFNRTHICPFNNRCPRSIISEYGERNCAQCHYTITTNNHLLAIGAHVRKLCEEIVDIREVMNRGQLDEHEFNELDSSKARKLTEASFWVIRYVISTESDDLFLITAEGRTQLIKDKPDDKFLGNKELYFLKRLCESQGAEALQSEQLKKKAFRLARRLELFISKSEWQALPEMTEVDEALALFKHVSTMYGLSFEQQISLLSDSNKLSPQLLSLAK
ncbi:hypothetical protein [Vibrio diazotrophicus]|uniref:hypothetical protein n=2 Tax=Vibrio diazotrophicus TaxID=685 RepID=UPI0005AAA839|nr:hypothetical protein [Vibrio diazotrophicus]